MQPQSSDKVVQKEKEQDMKMKMKVVLPLPIFMAPAAETRKATINLDKAIAYELKHGRKLDPKMDTKKLRRTISNRLSAQRSRLKRSQFIVDLERRVKELEEVVASLTPRIHGYHEKKRTLKLENDSLRTILDIRAAESKIAEERLEEKRREIREMKEALARANGDQQPSSSQRDSGSDELNLKPYSIQFYQERLMQLEMNQFISPEMNTGGALPRQDSMMESTFDGDGGEEEEEVDKYLNLTDEEELDLHLANL
ncbi:hypothetical protein AAHA92_13657 [Salvia divinorum]|uniref:BZIP domain-containing protein n=1 Tax=Salvia divinorum TaxID=28513 RepID=A0ABD1H8Z1_SALDI